MTTKCPKCHSDNPDTKQFCGDCGTQLTSAEEPDESFTRTLETPSDDLPRGTLFAGRYEIIESLGTGGMGKVYRVEDTKAKEEIALKLIKPEIAADKKTIDRFRNELTSSRKIRHKNICGMYDLGEDKGSYYITMEYVTGEDLKSLIRRVKQIPIGTAISITKQVCDGLSEAHQLGVIHRDLKPSNIMIDKQGNARIMDFGIARSLNAKGITRAGAMIGTPEYMSPEQVEGKDVDNRSDLYSLGIILFEMVTGSVPFEGETPLSIARMHADKTPPDPKSINPQISDDLSHLILKCLEKDKENRYQSAGELITELGNIEKGIPSTAREIPKRKPITSKEITVTLGLKKLFIPALVILALAVVAFLLFRESGPVLDPNRIVVAVFDNQTGDPAHDVIGRMAADWITQGLSQTGLVDVVPAISVGRIYSSYEGEDPLGFLAQATKAGTAISGSYYLQGDSVQFHAQVTDVRKGKLLTALDPVSGPAEDPTKPIKSLRQKLMTTLAQVFDPKIKDEAEFMYMPSSYEAYREYLEGMALFMNNEFKQALDHFLRAASLDPEYAQPRLWAFWAYSNLGEYAKADALVKEVDKLRDKLVPYDRYSLDYVKAMNRRDYYGTYQAAVQRAQLTATPLDQYDVGEAAVWINRPQETVDLISHIDPEGPEYKGLWQYWVLLTEAHHMLGNHKKELKEARRGRKQYPDILWMLMNETRALAALGKIKEVNERLDESLNFPPGQVITPTGLVMHMGKELRAHGFREASLQVLERAIRLCESRPEEEAVFWWNRRRWILATALYTSERWEEAQVQFEELHKEYPDDVNYLGRLGTLAVRRGDRDEALRIAGVLENDKRANLYGRPTLWRARIAALLGETELAMRLLQEALAQGVTYQVQGENYIDPDMDLEPLYDYPPYIELMKPKG